LIVTIEVIRLHRNPLHQADLQSGINVLIGICLYGFAHFHQPGTWYFVGWTMITTVVLKHVLSGAEKQAVSMAALMFMISLIHKIWITVYPLAAPRPASIRIHAQ